EGLHALACLGLATRLAVGGRLAVGELVQRREFTGGEVRRRAQLARRAQTLAPRRRAPGPVVGAEDLEVVAAGGGDRAGVEDRHPGVGGELDPRLLAGPSQARLAPARVGAPVGGEVELVGT